jgi:hypothetical protein
VTTNETEVAKRAPALAEEPSATERFIAMIEKVVPRLLVIDVLPALASGPTMGSA